MAESGRRWGPYTYGNNNPVRFVDPDGMESQAFGGMTSFDEMNQRHELAQERFIEDPEKEKKKKRETDKEKAEVDINDKQALQELGLKAKEEFFLSFMAFMFSEYGLAYMAHLSYDFQGSGNLPENAHPISKVNDIATLYATGKVLVTIGKGPKAFRKEFKVPKGFRDTGKYVKIGAARAPVLTDGNVFISPDLTQHNTEGWKMAKSIKELMSAKKRMGTYDVNLNKVKK